MSEYFYNLYSGLITSDFLNCSTALNSFVCDSSLYNCFLLTYLVQRGKCCAKRNNHYEKLKFTRYVRVVARKQIRRRVVAISKEGNSVLKKEIKQITVNKNVFAFKL